MRHLYLLLFTTLVAGTVQTGFGQVSNPQVSSSRLNMSPQPPAELWKWTSGQAGITFTVVADNAVEATVRVAISVGTNIIAQTQPVPVLLHSGVNVISASTLLSGGLETFQAPSGRNYAEQIARENRLLSGTYTLCATVTNTSHTTNTRQSCRTFTVVAYSPPRLAGSAEEQDIAVGTRYRFSWLPITPPVHNVRYELKMIEILPGQTAMDAFEGNWGRSYTTTTSSTSVSWPAEWSPPKLGARYVWSVRAVNDVGEPLSASVPWAKPSVLRVVLGRPPVLGFPADSATIELESSEPLPLDIGDITPEGNKSWNVYHHGNKSKEELNKEISEDLFVTAKLRELGIISSAHSTKVQDPQTLNVGLYQSGNSNHFHVINSELQQTNLIPDTLSPSESPETDSIKDQQRLDRFEWSVESLPTGTLSYRFLLAELPPGQTPDAAIRDRDAIFFIEETSAPYFSFNKLPPLRPGSQYVWSVQVLDDFGNPLSAPDTIATPHIFTVQASQDGRSTSNSSNSSGRAMLFENTTKKGTRSIEIDSQILRDTNITLHTKLLNSQDTLYAEVFEDTVRVVMTPARATQEGQFWSGIIVGNDGSAGDSYLLVVECGNIVIGNIFWHGQHYQIRDIGGVHKLLLIDESVLLPELDPIEPVADEVQVPPEDRPMNDPPNRIDVLVVYTDLAAMKVGGDKHLHAETLLAVEETNLSFLMSGVEDLRLELLPPQRIFYSETNDFSVDLDWLTYSSSIQQLRDSLNADIVVMLIGNYQSATTSGLAHTLPFSSPYFEKYAFAVVSAKHATRNFTFGHEIGHLLGCDHEASSAKDAVRHTDATDAYGFVNPAQGWRTIMATQLSGGKRIPRLSNPNRKYGSDATGMIGPDSSTFNARVIERNKGRVANYRNRNDTVNSVWIMDAWEDNGQQPWTYDSTVYPWRSPSLQHGNQLRVADSKPTAEDDKQNQEHPTVFVKVRNGTSTAAKGTIELYSAQPNLTAQWDSSWQKVCTVDTVLPPHSRVDVQFQCPVISLRSSQMFIARWVPASDPPSMVEPQNLIHYVFHNNTVVWNNEQVIDFRDNTRDTSKPITRELQFKAVKGSRIEVICDRPSLSGITFVEHKGELLIDFDSATSAALVDTVQVDGTVQRTTGAYRVIDPDGVVFPMPAMDEDQPRRVTISFKEHRIIHLNVSYKVHVVQKAANGTLLGGSTYIIRGMKYHL